ncbi:MAG: GNAT family N-acetyltransferase [Rhodoblastus sp.]
MTRFVRSFASAAAPSTWDVRIVDDPREVAEQWRFLEESGHATAFQTRAWLQPWLDIVAPAHGAEPVFVLVSGYSDGAPKMLLPLCRRTWRTLRAIEFADLGASDYNAPLLANDFRPTPAQFAGLWAQIRARLPAADIVRIDKSPATVGEAPNPLADLPFMRRLSLGAWRLSLPGAREAYEREMLSAHARKTIKSKRRRLGTYGDLRLRWAGDRDEAVGMLRELVEMRSRRFTALGRHDILADPAFCAFYESLFSHPQNAAEICALDVGGARVALLFGLRCGETFLYLMSGFAADEWAARSVGSVATDLAIARAIAAGLRTFDFTIGNERFKRDFGARRYDLYGGAQTLTSRALPQVARSWLKGFLRERLRASKRPL